MKFLYSLLIILRPLNVILSCTSVIIAMYVFNGNIYHDIIFYPLLVIFFYTSGANVINDLYDIKSDIINHPKRPLPSNNLNKKTVIFYCILLFLIGFLSSIKINFLAFCFCNFLILPLIIFYTPFFKAIPILGNVIVSFILGSVFIFSELAFTSNINKSLIIFGLAFMLSLIRELAKDMADIGGDSRLKVSTFPVKMGLEYSLLLIYIFSFILCVLSISIFIILPNNFTYLAILLLAVHAPLIVGIFSLRKQLTNKSASKFAITTKWITITGMLAITQLNI